MPLIKKTRPTTAIVSGNKEIKNNLVNINKEKQQALQKKAKYDLNVANVYFNDYIDMQYRVMNQNTERYLNAFGQKDGAKMYNKNNQESININDDYDGGQYAHTVGNDVNILFVNVDYFI